MSESAASSNTFVRSQSMLKGSIDNYLNSDHSNSLSTSSSGSDLSVIATEKIISTTTTTAITTNTSTANMGQGQNVKLDETVDDPVPALSNASTNGRSSSASLATTENDGSNHSDNNNSSSSSSADICYIPNKEPRMYDKEKEEKGFQQILAALTDDEKRSVAVDPNLIMRHYRADKGDVAKAIKRLKYAIQWRIDSKVDDMINAVHFTTEDCSEEQKKLRETLTTEGETGKVFARGYNKEGRALLYFYPIRENTYNGQDNIKHLIYEIERGIACSEKNGYEKLMIVMDFKDWTMKKAANMAVTKETIHILQDCYVERMKRVFMTNTPLIFRTFWAMVKPWLDPVTRNKIVFCGSGKKSRDIMEKEFDLKVLEKCACGTEDLKDFDPEEYFSSPFDTVFDEK